MIRKVILPLLCAGLFICSYPVWGNQEPVVRYTKADFINVEGGSLTEKIDRVVRQFKGSNQGDTVWLAYHFSVRDGLSYSPFGTMSFNDDGIRLDRRDNPASAALFMLVDASGTQHKITKLRMLNLDDPYVFENRRVYWLGNIDANQSMDFLEKTFRSDAGNRSLTRSAIRTISLHEGSGTVSLLKRLASDETDSEVQKSAVSGLGRIKSDSSIEALISLYDESKVDSLKSHIISSLAGSRERKALDKLMAIAQNDPEPKQRQRAIRSLSAGRSAAIWSQ